MQDLRAAASNVPGETRHFQLSSSCAADEARRPGSTLSGSTFKIAVQNFLHHLISFNNYLHKYFEKYQLRIIIQIVWFN
jgi:hypothetical protein